MSALAYRQNLIARHKHVGLPDDRKAQTTRCSCGWSFSHPATGERRAALYEHMDNPVADGPQARTSGLVPR